MALIFGSMIGSYLICKVIEWIIIKRIIKNYNAMVIISAVIVAILCVLAWRYRMNIQGSYSYDDRTQLGAQVIGSLALPFVRIFWNKRRVAKASAKAKS